VLHADEPPCAPNAKRPDLGMIHVACRNGPTPSLGVWLHWSFLPRSKPVTRTSPPMPKTVSSPKLTDRNSMGAMAYPSASAEAARGATNAASANGAANAARAVNREGRSMGF
jgi:hypothetical protein